MVEVNRILKPDMKPGMFMSMLLGRMYVDQGLVRLCGCGHERPLVYRANKRKVQAYDAGGMVLGVVPDLGPILNDIDIELAPGDQLLLYTDGVTEAMNEFNKPYGLQRLMKIFAKYGHYKPRQLIAVLIEDLQRHRGTAEQNDDVTLIVIRRQ